MIMRTACWARSAIPFMSGMSATGPGKSFPSGPPGTSTTSACLGATPLTKPKNPSGGPDWPPGRRRLVEGRRRSLFLREAAMSTMRFDDLKQYSDTLRTRQGEPVTLRFVEPRDGEELQHYFRSLSSRSRYNRFFGALSELPKS